MAATDASTPLPVLSQGLDNRIQFVVPYLRKCNMDYEYHPVVAEHEVQLKELGKITEEELAQWERAARVRFLDLFGKLLNYDFSFFNRVEPELLNNPEAVSRRDYDYFKEIRTRVYTFGNLGTLKGVMGPEQTRSGVNITVSIDQRQIDTEEAKRAASRDLLERFNANSKYLPEQELIEGEVITNGRQSAKD